MTKRCREYSTPYKKDVVLTTRVELTVLKILKIDYYSWKQKLKIPFNFGKMRLFLK